MAREMDAMPLGAMALAIKTKPLFKKKKKKEKTKPWAS